MLFGIFSIVFVGIIFLYYFLQGTRPPVLDLEYLKASQKTSTSTLPYEKDRRLLCPEWVNCMPGNDINVRCVIPPECEGYTQKAY